MKHLKEEPEPPSARHGRPVSPQLEALLLRCLAKAQADRPADAADLLRELEKCMIDGQWTPAAAATWWATYVENAEYSKLASAETSLSHVKPPTPSPETTMAYDKTGGNNLKL